MLCFSVPHSRMVKASTNSLSQYDAGYKLISVPLLMPLNCIYSVKNAHMIIQIQYTCKWSNTFLKRLSSQDVNVYAVGSVNVNRQERIEHLSKYQICTLSHAM